MIRTVRRGTVPILIAAALIPVSPAVPAPGETGGQPGSPRLSIRVDDGTKEIHSGDSTTYRIVVRNAGPDTVPMRLTARIPRGLADISVGDAGKASGQFATWDLKAARGETVVRLTGDLAQPAGAQVALTACAYVGDTAKPTVCASDLDRMLPARPTHWIAWTAASAGAVVLAALATGLFLWSRRRRDHSGSGQV